LPSNDVSCSEREGLTLPKHAAWRAHKALSAEYLVHHHDWVKKKHEEICNTTRAHLLQYLIEPMLKAELASPPQQVVMCSDLTLV
jgi:hypothetical protein